MKTEWLGNRRFYRKLAAVLSVYAVGSVYALYAAVQVIWRGERWVIQPLALLGVAAAILAFGLLAYTIILLLDGLLWRPDERKNAQKRIIPLP